METDTGGTRRSIREFLLVRGVCDFRDIIPKRSMSLIEVYEFLVGLQVPSVDICSIDRLVTSIGASAQDKDASVFGDIPVDYFNQVFSFPN